MTAVDTSNEPQIAKARACPKLMPFQVRAAGALNVPRVEGGGYYSRCNTALKS